MFSVHAVLLVLVSSVLFGTHLVLFKFVPLLLLNSFVAAAAAAVVVAVFSISSILRIMTTIV